MTALVSSPPSRTVARAGRTVAYAGIRGGFWLLERTAPGIGAKWAERLWFTVPPKSTRHDVTAKGGRRFETGVYNSRVVGETWGDDGPTVYLLHGWGGRRQQLGAMVEPLVAARHRVVSFDAPGHGQSDPGPEGRGRGSILELAEALRSVAAVHGPAHAVVAHSIGCMAAAIAVHDGLDVERLVFVAPMADIAPYTREFARRVGFGERIRTRLVPRIERHVGMSLSYFDTSSLGARIASPPPLLLAHDRQDPETDVADSETIADAWPTARLHITDGLGHNRILVDPAVVAEVVKFLNGSGPAPE